MSIERVTRKSGDRWVVRWWPDGAGGAHRQRTFANETDAMEFEVRMRRRRQLGAPAPAEPSAIRLGDYLEAWWRQVELEPSTRRVWRSLLQLCIADYIGSTRLRDLGTARVREWRAEILAAGCTVTQANRAQTVLSAALGVAISDGLLPEPNPCASVKRRHEKPRRPRALTPEEVERIRAAMFDPVTRKVGRGGRGVRVAPNASAPWDALLVSILCYAGLRPTEALFLAWGDIGRVLVVDPRKVAGGPRRTIEIVAPLAEDLNTLRPRRLRGDELVFANQSGRPWNLNNWRSRVWAPALERAGVAPTTPYDGRHTCASLLIHEGRALPYVTAALGHASAATTLKHYAHLFDEARLAPAKPMVEAIAEARAAVGDVRNLYAQGSIAVLRQPRQQS